MRRPLAFVVRGWFERCDCPEYRAYWKEQTNTYGACVYDANTNQTVAGWVGDTYWWRKHPTHTADSPQEQES